MVLGEEVFTGGTALKSDILAKKIGFFKNLGEHVQLIGERIIVQSGISGTDANTLAYTVPANIISFVPSIQMTSTNTGITTDRDIVVSLGSGSGRELFRLNVPPNDSINYLHTFTPILIACAGDPFFVIRNNTNADHVGHMRMVVYEVPAEISIQ